MRCRLLNKSIKNNRHLRKKVANVVGKLYLCTSITKVLQMWSTTVCMNDLPSFHLLANCVAAFSFLTSAVLMALVRVPHSKMWIHLRKCKYYLSLVFLVVGISCSKTIFFQLAPDTDIIVCSTLISAGIQSFLFACTGVTFVNPLWIKKRWVCFNVALVLAYSTLLLLGICLWKPFFLIISVVACLTYFALLTSYQFVFYGEYSHCVDQTDMLTDEYSESRYAWIKHFFITVSVLGVTAGIAPFLPTLLYDMWMLAAASLYAYVVVSFVNYCGNTVRLVNKVYEAAVPANNCEDNTPDIPNESSTSYLDFERIDSALQQWVQERGFVKNDLMSEEFAHSLGVSISMLRSYFNLTYQSDFRQWRTKLRIDYACTIIKEHPDYSYDVIAEMVGIGDRSNFTRIFKKNIGMTPKEYADKCKTMP